MNRKLLAALITLALALSFTTLGVTEEKAKSDKPAAAESKEPMYSVSCPAPCKFSVKSHDKQEVTAILKEHAKTHHNMTMSDKDAADMIKMHEPKQ